MDYRDQERVLFLGPKAQQILAPYLKRAPLSYCFSPAESEAQRKAELRRRRKTKVQPSQFDRSKRNAKRKPRAMYDGQAYLSAVHRACDRAFGEKQGPVTWLELAELVRTRRLGPRDMLRCGTLQRWKRAGSEVGLFDQGRQSLADESKIGEAIWFYKKAIPRWSPNQLRHAAASEIRKNFGLEAAQVVLGHRKADTTQIYAERDLAKAADIMREVG
jgi:integrase